MSDDLARLLRVRAQLLVPSSHAQESAPAVVEWVCGIQAQDSEAAYLAVRVRSRDLTMDDVERALAEERSVVRTWAFRGTLHLLSAADLEWLLPLLGPTFIRASRRRRLELGLDDETCERGIRELRRVLANRGPLSRAEIARHLSEKGIPAEGQAVPHLLGRAALEGVICLGPQFDGKPTYVLLDDWLRLGRSAQERLRAARGKALYASYAELARRYLNAYAPATTQDMAAWSGLPISTIKAAWERIASILVSVEVAGHKAWMLKNQAHELEESAGMLSSDVREAAATVRLLPSFDTYLLGYRSREMVVEARHARRLHPGGGVLRPAVLVNGKVTGTWKLNRRKKKSGEQLDVIVEPFAPFDSTVEEGLEDEVASLGRFLGAAAGLRLASAK